MSNFSPPPMKSYSHMTHIPGRRPEWKPHVHVGHAKSAIQQRMTGYSHNRKTTVPMQVLVWDVTDWKVLWDIPSGTPYSELPWIDTPEVKAKEAVQKRKTILYKLEHRFFASHDLDKLAQVWNAKATEPLEDQLNFNPNDYL